MNLQNYFRLAFLTKMTFLSGCLSHFDTVSQKDIPSWVHGIKSGEESLRIINGNRIFFRRIVSDDSLNKDEMCEKALSEVKNDLQSESSINVKIPYTLDYLLYVPKFESCAVTISVSNEVLSRVQEIKSLNEKYEEEISRINSQLDEERSKNEHIKEKNQMLERYISSNAHLLERQNILNNQYEAIRQGILREEDKVSRYFLTGMKLQDLEKLISKKINIIVGQKTPCWDHYSTWNISVHGKTHVCWQGSRFTGAYIRGTCDTTNRNCYYRDP
jgi:hypothetical protein